MHFLVTCKTNTCLVLPEPELQIALVRSVAQTRSIQAPAPSDTHVTWRIISADEVGSFPQKIAGENPDPVSVSVEASCGSLLCFYSCVSTFSLFCEVRRVDQVPGSRSGDVSLCVALRFLKRELRSVCVCVCVCRNLQWCAGSVQMP